MSGKAIGIRLPLGYRGNVSRTPDTIISPFTNKGEDNIPYGAPVVFDKETKGVRALKSGDAAATAPIVGIAVRHIGQPYSDSPEGYYYAPGDVVDVLVRGSIVVELSDTEEIAAQGKLFACDGSHEDHQPGDFVCKAGDNSDTIEVPGAIIATGVTDESNLAEITILTRSI